MQIICRRPNPLAKVRAACLRLLLRSRASGRRSALVEAICASKMPEAVSLITGRWAPKAGEFQELRWNAIGVNGGEMLFELGAPLRDLHFGLYKMGELEVSRFFRRSKALLEVLMGHIGESFGDHFFASRLSVLRHGRCHAEDEDPCVCLVRRSTLAPPLPPRPSVVLGVAGASFVGRAIGRFGKP